MADTLVMPIEGRKLVARWWLGEGPGVADTLSLHLFSEGPDPFESPMVEGDFVESVFSGYEAKEYQYGDNAAPVTNATKEDVQIGSEVVAFECDGAGEVVAGWYLRDDDSGKLLYACLYETPVTMISGATHTVDLKIAVGLCD